MKIVGIDPGTSTLGVAVLTGDTVVQHITATTITPWQRYKQDYFAEPREWVTAHQRTQYLMETLNAYLPQDTEGIAIESPFFDRFRPFAYGVLLQHQLSIKSLIQRRYPWIPVTDVAPSEAKKAIGYKKKSTLTTKESVTYALQNHSVIAPLINLNRLDEHSQDAISIAYALWQSLIELTP